MGFLFHPTGGRVFLGDGEEEEHGHEFVLISLRWRLGDSGVAEGRIGESEKEVLFFFHFVLFCPLSFCSPAWNLMTALHIPRDCAGARVVWRLSSPPIAPLPRADYRHSPRLLPDLRCSPIAQIFMRPELFFD